MKKIELDNSNHSFLVNIIVGSPINSIFPLKYFLASSQADCSLKESELNKVTMEEYRLIEKRCKC